METTNIGTCPITGGPAHATTHTRCKDARHTSGPCCLDCCGPCKDECSQTPTKE